MQGRITERHFSLAEKSCPGIRRLYEDMAEKPATFLQLLWEYEGRRQAARGGTPRATPRNRR